MRTGPNSRPYTCPAFKREIGILHSWYSISSIPRKAHVHSLSYAARTLPLTRYNGHKTRRLCRARRIQTCKTVRNEFDCSWNSHCLPENLHPSLRAAKRLASSASDLSWRRNIFCMNMTHQRPDSIKPIECSSVLYAEDRTSVPLNS